MFSVQKTCCKIAVSHTCQTSYPHDVLSTPTKLTPTEMLTRKGEAHLVLLSNHTGQPGLSLAMYWRLETTGPPASVSYTLELQPSAIMSGCSLTTFSFHSFLPCFFSHQYSTLLTMQELPELFYYSRIFLKLFNSILWILYMKEITFRILYFKGVCWLKQKSKQKALKKVVLPNILINRDIICK